jgi:hypothetical protein
LSKKDTSNTREVSITRHASNDKYTYNSKNVTDIRERQQRANGTNSSNSMDAGTAGTHQEQKVTEGMPATVGTPAEGMLATTGGMQAKVMKPIISTPVTVETPAKNKNAINSGDANKETPVTAGTSATGRRSSKTPLEYY